MSDPAYRDDPAAALTGHLDEREAIERQGRAALAAYGHDALADMAATLFAVVVAAQADALPGAAGLDVAAIEDVGSWLLARAAEKRAA